MSSLRAWTNTSNSTKHAVQQDVTDIQNIFLGIIVIFFHFYLYFTFIQMISPWNVELWVSSKYPGIDGHVIKPLKSKVWRGILYSTCWQIGCSDCQYIVDSTLWICIILYRFSRNFTVMNYKVPIHQLVNFKIYLIETIKQTIKQQVS